MDKRLARSIVMKNLKLQGPADRVKYYQSAIDLDAYRRSRMVLGYIALGTEADPSLIMAQARRDGKIVAIPYCLDNRKMAWCRWEENMSLKVSSNKTLVSSSPRWVDLQSPCFALVPCLGLDSQGYRLGRGGGYYDVFLKANPNIFSFSFIRDFQIVDFDRGDFDQRLSSFLVEL